MKKNINKLAVFSGLVATCMYSLNKLSTSLATSKNILATDHDKFYDWRFGKIRYIKKGHGNPVLLLHRLSEGSSLYEFHKIIDKLSESHEVYAIDLLGYGLSQKPELTYTNFLYVELLSDFIKNVIGRKTSIVSSGESASISIMTCFHDENLLDRLIFINPPNLFQMNEIPSIRTKYMKHLLDAPILGTFIYHIYNNEAVYQKKLTKYGFYDPSNCTERDLNAYMEASHFRGRHAKYSYSSFHGKYMNTNIIHALKEINHSMMIIASKDWKDAQTNVDNYQYYNASIESAFINHAKDLIALEQPVKICHYINTFLS